MPVAVWDAGNLKAFFFDGNLSCDWRAVNRVTPADA